RRSEPAARTAPAGAAGVARDRHGGGCARAALLEHPGARLATLPHRAAPLAPARGAAAPSRRRDPGPGGGAAAPGVLPPLPAALSGSRGGPPAGRAPGAGGGRPAAAEPRGHLPPDPAPAPRRGDPRRLAPLRRRRRPRSRRRDRAP